MSIRTADVVERWSSALLANDAPSVGQFVQEGHVLRASVGTRWIGKAENAEPSAEPSDESSERGLASTTPNSNVSNDRVGLDMERSADNRMAVRELARGRRQVMHLPL